MQQGGEGHDEEGARAGAHDAVVAPDKQADEEAHPHLVGPGAGPSRLALPAEVPLHREEHRHQGQGHQHQALEEALAEVLGDLRPRVAPRQGPQGRVEGDAQPHLPAAQVADHGRGAAQAVDHLVGPGGEVDRHPGHQVGGQGDEPPAPGHAVHEPAQENERADDEVHFHEFIHSGTSGAVFAR